MNSDYFEAVLDFYRGLWPVMKVTPTHRWAVDPGAIPWVAHLSPIEQLIWGDIRNEGIVLYPQHPVAGYFVDFGHPVAKVALECDGRAYHMDKAKDAARQAAIEAKGWTVVRLTGKQCTAWDREEEDPETGDSTFHASTARQLLRGIARVYGLSARYIKAAA